MIQTKQQLIDSLLNRNLGTEADLKNPPAGGHTENHIGYMNGMIDARRHIIAQLKRELSEEAEADRPGMGEDTEAARRERLEAALREYFGNDYMLNYIVAAEVTNTELEQEGKTMVTYIQGQDQSFVSTRGLLDISLHSDRVRHG